MNRFDRAAEARTRQKLLLARLAIGFGMVGLLFLKDFGPAAIDPAYPATQLAKRIEESLFGLGGVLTKIPVVSAFTAAHPRLIWLALAGLAAVGAARTPVARWLVERLLPHFDHDLLSPVRRAPPKNVLDAFDTQVVRLPPRLPPDPAHPRRQAYEGLLAWVRKGSAEPPRWLPWAEPKAQALSIAYVVGRTGSGKTWLAHHLARAVGQRARFGGEPPKAGLGARLQVWLRTRAIFLERREDDPWDAGLLEARPAVPGRPARDLAAVMGRFTQAWRPARPTLVILDDAEPSEIASAVEALRAAATRFRHPVRLLIVSQTLPESSGLRWSPAAQAWLDSRGEHADPQPFIVAENAWLDRSEVDSLCDDSWFLGATAKAVADRGARDLLFAVTRGNPLLVALAFEWLAQGNPLSDMTATALVRQRAERVAMLLKATGMSLAQLAAEASVSLADGAEREALRALKPGTEMPDAPDLRRMFPGETRDLSAWVPPVRPPLIGGAFAEAVIALGASADDVLLTAARLNPPRVMRLVRWMPRSSERLAGAIQRLSKRSAGLFDPDDLAKAWLDLVFSDASDDLFFQTPIGRGDVLALAGAAGACGRGEALAILDQVLRKVESAAPFDPRPLGIWLFMIAPRILNSPVVAEAPDWSDLLLGTLSRMEQAVRRQPAVRGAWQIIQDDADAWTAVVERFIAAAGEDQMGRLGDILAAGWDEQGPHQWRAWFAQLAGGFGLVGRSRESALTRLWRIQGAIPARADSLAVEIFDQLAAPATEAEARLYARAYDYGLAAHSGTAGFAAFVERVEAVGALLEPFLQAREVRRIWTCITADKIQHMAVTAPDSALAALRDELAPAAAAFPDDHAVQLVLLVAVQQVTSVLVSRSDFGRERGYGAVSELIDAYTPSRLAAWKDRPGVVDLAAAGWRDVLQAARWEPDLTGTEAERLIDGASRPLAEQFPGEPLVQSAFAVALACAVNLYAFRPDPDQAAMWRLTGECKRICAAFPQAEEPHAALAMAYSSIAAVADEMDYPALTRLVEELRSRCSPLLSRFPGHPYLAARVRDAWWNCLVQGARGRVLSPEMAEQIMSRDVQPLLEAHLSPEERGQVLIGGWHTVAELYANRGDGEGLEDCERIARQKVSPLSGDLAWRLAPGSPALQPVLSLTTAAWWEVVRAATALAQPDRLAKARRCIESEMEPIAARLPADWDAQRNVVAAWKAIATAAYGAGDRSLAAEAARRGLSHIARTRQLGLDEDLTPFEEPMEAILAECAAG